MEIITIIIWIIIGSCIYLLIPVEWLKEQKLYIKIIITLISGPLIIIMTTYLLIQYIIKSYYAKSKKI